MNIQPALPPYSCDRCSIPHKSCHFPSYLEGVDGKGRLCGSRGRCRDAGVEEHEVVSGFDAAAAGAVDDRVPVLPHDLHGGLVCLERKRRRHRIRNMAGREQHNERACVRCRLSPSLSTKRPPEPGPGRKARQSVRCRCGVTPNSLDSRGTRTHPWLCSRCCWSRRLGKWAHCSSSRRPCSGCRRPRDSPTPCTRRWE